MDKGEISILWLLNQSKCFDVVPHQTLLQKLRLYDINTHWLTDYLAGHTQQVKLRTANGSSITSRSKENNIGVFQGGSLSCVLHMIFANDLSLHVPDGVSIAQYADDTNFGHG